MRKVLSLVLFLALTRSAVAQAPPPQGACVNGQCPVVAAPPAAGGPASQSAAVPAQVDPRAIVRVENVHRGCRALGTGTLVDVTGTRGLVVTCAHLFREGNGRVSVTFPGHQASRAELISIDPEADLAAIAVDVPRVEPVTIAEGFPQPGEPLVSCGYGSDGQLWCNRGAALGYVTLGAARGTETLEISGTARFGDSGGPVLDRQGHLVAVLFGTNGQVVDGTYCGRVRRFLSGLCPRFRRRPPATGAPLVESPPAVQPPAVQPAPGVANLNEQIGRLERLAAGSQQSWSAAIAKLDAVVAALDRTRDAIARGGSSPLQPPTIEFPPGGPAVEGTDPIGKVVEPLLSARLAALLVSLGIPGGVAGVAAGAIVYVVMRRGKRRLQDQLARLKRGEPREISRPAGGEPSEAAVVERHHNQYVPYEATTLDKAWAEAHAHVGEKYPGAVPYLKMVEGVKDQLLSGTDSSQVS